MKKGNIYMTLTAVALMSVTACSNTAYDIIDNGVYISEAENSNLKQIKVDDTGGKTTVTVRAAAPYNEDVHVTVGAATAAELAAFNKKNGTSYVALPDTNYTLSTTEVILPKGKITASTIELGVKSLSAQLINTGDKFVIPITIKSADNAIHEVAKTMFFSIDQVIVTQAAYIKEGKQITVTMDDQIKTVPWTMEYRVWVKDLSLVQSLESWGAGPATEIYLRWGDANVDPHLIMMKTQGGQFISTKKATAGKWYHHAWVHDGKTVKLYINGELDAQMDSPGKVSELTKNMGLYAGHSDVMYSEFRFWTTARTQKQIKDNMFSVSPTSEGLEVYLKLNDGTGNSFKESTGKHNIKASSTNVEWKQIRSDEQ